MKKNDDGGCFSTEKVLQKAHNGDHSDDRSSRPTKLERALGMRPDATFKEIATELGMTWQGAEAVFFRAVHKILLDARRCGADTDWIIDLIPRGRRCGPDSYAAHVEQMTDEQRSSFAGILPSLRAIGEVTKLPNEPTEVSKIEELDLWSSFYGQTR